MNIINEGEIVINDKTRAGEVAQIMVTAGLYDATEDVPVYENDGTTPKEAGVSIHEVYGNIDTALQEVADKCKEAGIILNGQVCYSGDYYGRYYITDNVVEDLTADEIGVREASNEELIAELKRRGLAVTVQKNQLSESEKSADLPALCAYDIKWDTDGDAKVFNGLPERMFIPKELVDNDVISDYLSDEIGYCHAGFKIGIMFRGSILPYYTNWLDSDTFQMWFGEDIFRDPEGDSYLIKFEKHLKDNEWVVEIIWDEDLSNIEGICNADDYITANEIWKIERICEKMIQPDSNEVPETDGKGNSVVELGKTYQFAGYKWTACELINKGKTLVIQSHGVTHGKWPGFKMEKFGNGNYYADSIDGQDISAYDNKMQALYDAIEDVEDTSASYGKGLYLISEEKVGFTELGHPGSGNYWQALKAAAENARSFWAAYCAWLGTVDDSSAWCIHLNGNVYCGSNQTNGFVVAPAFNLDLSKVEIVGDEIIIKSKKQQIIIKPQKQKLEIDKMLTISSRHVSADTKDLLDQAADDNEEDPMPSVYEKQGYGWLVACDPDNEETWDNYPADLVQCMKLTRDNGCFWLCLDADGPRVETLEFFD
ncbi:hypothetical protein [Roseburia faecis]|uniref:DUF5983 family protein n=1 Tax=Roseburia faecis TaxID=301302 RepID=UPI0031B642A0